MLRKTKYLLTLLVLAAALSLPAAAGEKLRVIVLTDIENEPDDAMSLVRFLTYSNQWDVEGLIALRRCIRNVSWLHGASRRL